MIENLRKYTGLIIVIFAIVIVAFVLGDYSRSSRSLGGGANVIKIDGRNYNEKEVRRLGVASFELTSGLARSGDFSLYQFLIGLSGNSFGQDDSAENFFIGRMILRDAQDEFGIHPGDEEISKFIRNMRAFAGPDGKFSQEAYNRFIEKGIGRLGLTESDLRELAADVLVSQKLNTIVGSGLGFDRETTARALALNNQQVAAEIARLDIAPYEAKIEPTEDEIKAYWETIQDAFTTEPRRKFTYIVARPDFSGLEETEEAPLPAVAEDADEAAKAAAKKAEEERAARIAARAEERRKKQTAVDAQVDDFLYSLEQQKGAGFEDLAKANQWEVKTTGFFTQSEPPEDLAVNLRASSQGGKAADLLFRIQETKDPFSKISEAIATGENQWIVARLDGEEKSRVKTYEEARDEARAQYIAEKATESLKTAAEETAAKIKEALAAGKSFADAAKEAGIEEVKPVEKVNAYYRPDPSDEPQNLFEATRNIDPGTLADVIVETDRAFIVYVSKREVVKEENAETRLDGELASAANQNEIAAFSSWLSERIEAAKVQRLDGR